MNKNQKRLANRRNRRNNNRLIPTNNIRAYRQGLNRAVKIRNGISKRLGFPRIRLVRYGQQQDLAFKPRKFKNKNKGIGNTFTTPVSESKTIETYFKFNNNTITLCQPVAAICYQDNIAIVSLHPMMVNARCANMAGAFTCYQMMGAVLHSVPLIGSTSTGMIAIGSTQRSVPLTSVVGSQFASLTSVNAEINPVWMCTKYSVKDLDNTLKNMEPNNKSDVPNTIYVVGSGLAGALNVSCTLFLEVSYVFSKPTPNVYLSLIATTPTIVISNAGIRTSSAGATYFGIVLTSTATNIDVGELIRVPAMTAAATDYAINVEHNGQITNYLNALDEGTLVLQVVWVQ